MVKKGDKIKCIDTGEILTVTTVTNDIGTIFAVSEDGCRYWIRSGRYEIVEMNESSEKDYVRSTSDFLTKNNKLKDDFPYLGMSIDEIAKNIDDGVRESYDHINPSHYKKGSKETYEKMLDIYGIFFYMAFCEQNAFKYRDRVGSKPEQPVERDLAKVKWYEDKYSELFNSFSEEGKKQFSKIQRAMSQMKVEDFQNEDCEIKWTETRTDGNSN